MTKRRSRGTAACTGTRSGNAGSPHSRLATRLPGKRIVKKASGKTKTAAKDKLKEIVRDYEDGLAIAPGDYTVERAVNDWLTYGLNGRDPRTVESYAILCRKHVIPALGKRKLRDLSAEDVDRWLADKAKTLSTRTLQIIRSCLNRALKRAMARDKVKRNVVELCSVPAGKAGRPSKALTFAQADAVLKAATGTRLYAYVVVSLLTGARTEELRALTWDHVDLEGDPKTVPPVPPHVAVWRSVRADGDTKTRKSRRTLALPRRCVEVLRQHRNDQRREQDGSSAAEGLAFASSTGTELDASNVRRAFRIVIRDAEGLNPAEWTPRELRHSFVSLLSDNGIPLEEISRLVGHSSTAVTEAVYRKQIRPVLQTGAVAMDHIFEGGAEP